MGKEKLIVNTTPFYTYMGSGSAAAGPAKRALLSSARFASQRPQVPDGASNGICLHSMYSYLFDSFAMVMHLVNTNLDAKLTVLDFVVGVASLLHKYEL